MAKTFEEKNAKFNDMMNSRLPKAEKAIELLGNLSRKSDYAWTDKELQAVMDRLDDAIDGVMEAFGVAAPKETAAEQATREFAATLAGDTQDGVQQSNTAPDAAPGPYKYEPGMPLPEIVYRSPDGTLYEYLGIEHRDRITVRDALFDLTHNEVKSGTQKLVKMVLGWPM